MLSADAISGCIFRYRRARARCACDASTARGTEVRKCTHALRDDSPFLMCSASSSCCLSLTGSSMFLFSVPSAGSLSAGLGGCWSERLGHIRNGQGPDRSSVLARSSLRLRCVGFKLGPDSAARRDSGGNHSNRRPGRRTLSKERAKTQGRRFRPLSGSIGRRPHNGTCPPPFAADGEGRTFVLMRRTFVLRVNQVIVPSLQPRACGRRQIFAQSRPVRTPRGAMNAANASLRVQLHCVLTLEGPAETHVEVVVLIGVVASEAVKLMVSYARANTRLAFNASRRSRLGFTADRSILRTLRSSVNQLTSL